MRLQLKEDEVGVVGLIERCLERRERSQPKR